MPESNIAVPFEDDHTAALEMLRKQIKNKKVLPESISMPDLENAIRVTIDTLRNGPDTGGGRRLQQFVWSLWNGSHLVNLYNLSYGLDVKLTKSVQAPAFKPGVFFANSLANISQL